jgi:hypothetical protein
MAIKTWVGGGGVAGVAGKWSEAAGWSPSGVPALTSDIRFTGTSGNLEVAAAGKCRDIDFTGFTGTFTIKAAVELSIGTTTEAEGNIAFRAVSAMTFAGTGTLAFVSTSGKVEKITCAGKTLQALSFAGAGGKWQLQDALATTNLGVALGTLDTNGQAVTAVMVEISGATTRGLTLGASVIKLSSGGTAWNAEETTGLTFSCGTSSIELTGSGSAFAGGGLTYATVISGGEKQQILGSNTFATLSVNNKGCTVENGLKITAGTTQTITSSLTTNGTEANRARLETMNVGKHTLTKASGTVTVNNMFVKNSVAAGGASWYATSATFDSGGNEGWKFTEQTGKAAGALSLGVNLAGTAVKVANAAGALSVGARLTSSASRIAASSGRLSVGATLTPSGAKTASATGALSVGVRLAATGRSASEQTGHGTGALSIGVRVTPAGVSIRIGTGSLSVGARLSPTSSSVRSAAGALTVGVRLSASASKTATAAGGLSVGPSLGATYSTIRKSSGQTSVGVRLSGVGIGPVALLHIGRLSVGARLTGTGRAITITPQPPTGTPAAGTVSVAQAGRLRRGSGRVSTPTSGRAH